MSNDRNDPTVRTLRNNFGTPEGAMRFFGIEPHGSKWTWSRVVRAIPLYQAGHPYLDYLYTPALSAA